MNTVVAAILTFAASPMGQHLLGDLDQAAHAMLAAIFKKAIQQAHAVLPPADQATTPIVPLTPPQP